MSIFLWFVCFLLSVGISAYLLTGDGAGTFGSWGTQAFLLLPIVFIALMLASALEPLDEDDDRMTQAVKRRARRGRGRWPY